MGCKGKIDCQASRAYLEFEPSQPLAVLKKQCKFMKKIFIGIDFAKEKFDVTVTNIATCTSHYGQYPNTRGGGRSLLRMVRRAAMGIPESEWLFCGEDTGCYSVTIARYIAERGLFMWLQSPYCIKHGTGEIRRGKDDRTDSAMIADYARRHEDKAVRYDLPDETVDKLKLLAAQRDILVKVRTELVNSHHTIPKMRKQTDAVTAAKASARRVIRDIDAEIAFLEKKMEEIIAGNAEVEKTYSILRSFPGIGPVNATYLIVYTNNFKRFAFNPRKIATYWGVAPFGHQSGATLDKKPHVSGFCNHKLKGLLSAAASAAIRFNTVIAAYYNRLVNAGKPEGIARNNVKNKIIKILTAMVRKGEMYDPEHNGADFLCVKSVNSLAS